MAKNLLYLFECITLNNYKFVPTIVISLKFIIMFALIHFTCRSYILNLSYFYKGNSIRCS